MADVDTVKRATSIEARAVAFYPRPQPFTERPPIIIVRTYLP